MVGGFRFPRALAALALLSAAVVASDPPFPAAAVGLHDAPPVWMGPAGARIAVGPDGLVAETDGVRCWPIAPDAGPAQLSPSSSPATLSGTVDEFAALSFVDGAGQLQVGAAGSHGPDWAGRPPLTGLTFNGDEHGALAVGRLVDMKIRTEAMFFPQVPGVQITVSIQNRAAGPVTDVTYAREWRQADGRLARASWSIGTLQRKQSGVVVIWYLPNGASMPAGGNWPASALDLPVTLWTSPNHAFGLNTGSTNGIAWGDFDADGFPDLFAAASGNLWHNDGGLDWSLAAHLDALMPKATIRYSASFGDFDADGLPDLIVEPRKVLTGDTCWHLLHNVDGTGVFELADQQLDVDACLSDGETACWGDVDGDGRLDLFMPSYPSWVLNGAGNFLFRNTGASSGPLFNELSAAANADVPPPDTARPEGAQMCDVDGDGDIDLYSNGWLYQNDGAPGAPHFTTLPALSTGIAFPTVMDEGAAFFDYDLDGDEDLVVAYADPAFGVKLYENRGDGTFLETSAPVVDGPFLGLGLGLSVEDWDGDGDLDFSTRQVFRRNQLMETGTRKFTLGLVPIPMAFMSSATPAWADWDHDGDLDLALGNYLGNGSFWTNTSADASLPPDQRNDVRVVPLDEGPRDGTQTEYGASIEVSVHGEQANPTGGPLRRKRFVASSGGYLNQNDYGQTFHLPLVEPPGSQLGTSFDVTVDFPGAPGFAPGLQSGAGTLRRIDRHVNAALGDISLATLVDREIRVYRSGRVVLDGVSYEPDRFEPRDLSVTTGGLQLPTASSSTSQLAPAATPNRWIGLEMDTSMADHPVHVHELIVDAQLDAAISCGPTPFNVALWDTTKPVAPFIVTDGTLAASTSSRNSRSFIPVDFTLLPAHRYRLVVRATSFRFTTVTGPPPPSPLRVTGSLNFRNDNGCNGAIVAIAPVVTTRAYVAVRWAEESHTEWTDLGHALAGSAGLPQLLGSGELVGGSTVTMTLRGAKPFAPVWFILGLTAVNQPFKGGTLVPAPMISVGGLLANVEGKLQVSSPMSTNLPSSTDVLLQCWIADPLGPQGASASNALMGTSP
jgi:hypothetical protein